MRLYLLGLIAAGVKILNEYERGVVLTFGGGQ